MSWVESDKNFRGLGWVRCKKFGLGWDSKKRPTSNSGVTVRHIYQFATSRPRLWRNWQLSAPRQQCGRSGSEVVLSLA